MAGAVPVAIYVDARALQDSNYRFRGVGQHSVSLLGGLRRHTWGRQRPKIVALCDVTMEGLQPQHRLLFDEVLSSAKVSAKTAAGWFISLSPMTHDPIWAADYLENPSYYRIALFYDLIPMATPHRYLATPQARAEYIVALSWLRCYDTLAAISRFSGDEVVANAGIAASRVFVSGVAVRTTLEPSSAAIDIPFGDRRSIVVAGGGDPRKNPECAIIAHARSIKLRRKGIGLSVFGSYPESMVREFRERYAREGGRQQDLVFHAHLSDDELHEVYRRAVVTVVPSRAEGFSIPIVESSAASTPVIASDVGAHPELVRNADWRFDPDDPTRLQDLLEKLVFDETAWKALHLEQVSLWTGYTVTQVGRNFVEGVLERAPVNLAAPMIVGSAKPSIAVLSPLPPALSGVADYTVSTLAPLEEHVDLHMFTATANARWRSSWASLNPISVAPFSSKKFDATIAVVGNSYHHRAIYEYVRDYGGACIAHDARQIDFYFHEFGPAKAAAVASYEMGRSISIEEVAGWLRNQRDLPTLFLSELVEASDPLFVHSPTTAIEIERLYSKKPKLLPFAQYRRLRPNLGKPASRKAARLRLGVDDDAILLVTFGIVSPDKAPEEILWTLRLLREWGVNAKLAFCGLANETMSRILGSLVGDLSEHVQIFPDVITDDIYDDFLAGADVGIQLRTYFLGGLSGALNDCIAAALPSIANAHLAEAMLAPDFVRRVPDGLSSLLIAEAVLEILRSEDNLNRPVHKAADFARAHTPQRYCNLLLSGLGIETHISELIVDGK